MARQVSWSNQVKIGFMMIKNEMAVYGRIPAWAWNWRGDCGRALWPVVIVAEWQYLRRLTKSVLHWKRRGCLGVIECKVTGPSN